MRFLTLYTPDSAEDPGAPDPARMAALGKYTEDMIRAGVLVSQAMIDPSWAAVRLHAGKFTVTEKHGEIVGYAFIEASSKEQAIESAREFMQHAGDGVIEVRQVLDTPSPRGA